MEINNLKDIGNFIYKYRFILILALVIGFSYGFLKQKSNLDSSISDGINITKVVGSPEYENASLNIKSIEMGDEKSKFSFDIENYGLGIQTSKNFDYQLANSAKGQHIHFIINNGPYSAHYMDSFSKDFKKKSNVILAFLSRSYHESVKNKNAFNRKGENYSSIKKMDNQRGGWIQLLRLCIQRSKTG